ncbi:molybdopterin molybdenumtransferase MoeA [Sphingomonas paeninsulae]|jgi:molybdopterin molybdotransferase|uniref:Molybdopterin molybdenumtransferase n=1 Tax=Sphingomonas paeninsulae TaxID=2319844 RepID=A0A494TDJ6_SPHPE|nr:molybdopterin molybdotransferase MoeA [Sphingomonas paeninsulae]AYJ87567.1 molybdopterin molybdenumtransferase MoeA [Sphingomonas paeninsulae]
MIDVEEAQARILALHAPVSMEGVPLLEAVGRWTAAAVVAKRTQPAHDLSAMDGYAIRYEDAAGPWRVVGESAAGIPFAGQVGPGETIRIFTGAALPEGSDTIVIQENIVRDGDLITLTNDGPETLGEHVRKSGSDFTTGATLIEPGQLLTPARIALAVMGGHGTIAARRRLRVAIISTGSELVPPGTDTGTDRLPSSNAPMLAALMRNLPVDVVDLGIIEDDLTALTAAFNASKTCDIVVSTGGASVGDHDLVRPALNAAGATLDFWKVAMRPGKPLMAGRLGDTVVLGLPGNPVSALVTAILFLRPLIAHLSGASTPLPPRIGVRMGEPLPAVGPRTDFVRTHWEGGALVPTFPGDSGMLLPLSGADALVIRAAGSPALESGALVEAILLA